MRPVSKYVLVMFAVLGSVPLVWLANEARKEVYYLCGNFKAGAPYASVVRQLNSINLTRYNIERLDGGKRIVHSTLFGRNFVRCTITFNQLEKVITASYD